MECGREAHGCRSCAVAKATALPLTGLAHGFFYAGLTAWTLTFLGVLLAVARVLRGPR